MTNVPTDLLRTLIAVIDLRSFTRAAQLLGVTQPAVSAQIKRLQAMLDVDLFDKSAPGVTLTAKGEQMVGYARRMLALNDRMLDAAIHGGAAAQMRIGLAVDYHEGPVLGTLAAFRAHHPELRLQISGAHSSALLRDLRRGDYDLVVAASADERPANESRWWLEPSAWGAASAAVAEVEGPVPLLVVGEASLSRRLSVAALEQAGVDYQIVYAGGSFGGLVKAAKAGLGVACWARRLLIDAGLQVLDNSRKLPKVQAVYGGVHLREGVQSKELDALADSIAASVKGTSFAADTEPALRRATN